MIRDSWEPNWDRLYAIIVGLLALRRMGVFHAVYVDYGAIKVQQVDQGSMTPLSWDQAEALIRKQPQSEWLAAERKQA